MLTTILIIIIILYSIIFHEVAHGYAAYRNGDKTAYYQGRLTLNPIPHLSIIGSIIVPIVSYFLFKMPFGWAKPVPYNPQNFTRNQKYAELEVASAGILVNLFIALVAILLFYLFRYAGILNGNIVIILQFITSINIFLAIFNLLPFPPADGFSIFSELYLHLKDWFFKFKNLFRKEKEARVWYGNSFRNSTNSIKRLFGSPLTMVLIIFIAINVFELLVPYILQFIDFLYSF